MDGRRQDFSFLCFKGWVVPRCHFSLFFFFSLFFEVFVETNACPACLAPHTYVRKVNLSPNKMNNESYGKNVGLGDFEGEFVGVQTLTGCKHEALS